MIPWDFGVINAIKKKLNVEVFPSDPPQELEKSRYLIFNLKNIKEGINRIAKMEFSLIIVDKEETSGYTYAILRKINRVISSELDLYQGNFAIGSARVKINYLENKKNMLILNLEAILQLKALYENGEYDG